MLMARNGQGQLISSLEMTDSGDMICPGCHQRVYFKNGRQKIPHFAHGAHADCDTFSEGETKEHLQGKELLARFLAKDEGVLEAYLPQLRQRPDILWNKRALEFQCSPLPFQRFQERTTNYQRHGYHPWWILGRHFYPKRKFSHFQKACCYYTKRQIYLWHLSVEHGQLQRLGPIIWHYHTENSFAKKSWQLTDRTIYQEKARISHWHPDEYRELLAQKLVHSPKQLLLLQEQFYLRGQTLTTLPKWCYQASTFSFFFEERLLLLRYLYLLHPQQTFQEWISSLKCLTWRWDFPLTDQRTILWQTFQECRDLAGQ